MRICDLLNALINVAEKGANIARIIRSESSLLELLVQEKKGDQKNARFIQDFKTLADVLVQEVVKYDLSQKFPGISDSIYGEESNRFTNTLGDSVTVQIQNTVEETKKLLGTVLDENENAAHILAEKIHQDVDVCSVYNTQQLDQALSMDDVGIWIDPIDSTAQYIQGEMGETGATGLVLGGLQCVTVLIGAYHKTTGLPIVGVTNQPFHTLDTNGMWSGHTEWGVCVGDVKASSVDTTSSDSCNKSTDSSNKSTDSSNKSTILISSSEAADVQQALEANFTLQHVAGAGYKLLGVCQCRADAYLLTRSSNFKWDCCGPHAILLSLGGGIVNYSDVYQTAKREGSSCDYSKFNQIKYHIPDQATLTGAQKWCNDGGIIAYRSLNVLQQIGAQAASI